MTGAAGGCMLTGMTDIQLDNRGLQPPEPMVRILEAIRGLAPADRLVVLMDREPILLYPELERRGFAWAYVDDDRTLTVFKPGPA
ncbi:MAG: hypothetical protein C0506_12485 [Anaerolinea sp.]|nr:hypothetical protein [Anaerolinea sp.]